MNTASSSNSVVNRVGSAHRCFACTKLCTNRNGSVTFLSMLASYAAAANNRGTDIVFFGCPSVNTSFEWSGISLLSGRISLELATNIHYFIFYLLFISIYLNQTTNIHTDKRTRLKNSSNNSFVTFLNFCFMHPKIEYVVPRSYRLPIHNGVYLDAIWHFSYYCAHYNWRRTVVEFCAKLDCENLRKTASLAPHCVRSTQRITVLFVVLTTTVVT